MIAAGIGLRASATLADLRAVLALAATPPQALATPADKADHPALQDLARATGLPLHPVPLATLLAQITVTHSPHQPARYGTGSVAEAAALAAAGPGARLIQTRILSPGGLATLALASTEGQTA